MSSHIEKFGRNTGLTISDVEISLGALKKHYPNYQMQELTEQGQCSLTFNLTSNDLTVSSNETKSDSTRMPPSSLIVQLRPDRHALDLAIIRAANAVYPKLSPSIHAIRLSLPCSMRAYEMSRVLGVSLFKLLPTDTTIVPATELQLATLISSFATFVAKSWPATSSPTLPSRSARADSPMSNDTTFLAQCTGKVGSSILDRLEMLAIDLPDEELRNHARKMLQRVESMRNWPVVLTHGDLIPSNIMVDEQTWGITGVVDWAEAEFLPFGICLCGLDHMLGYMATTCDGMKRFVYYEGAAKWREYFWQCLTKQVPQLSDKVEYVKMWRDVGVLLWHGIAWDGGRLDRVVSESEDEEELVRLRACLGATRALS